MRKGKQFQPKNGKDKINYTYANVNNVINRLGVVDENVNMMGNKESYGNDLDMDSPIHGENPSLVLRGTHSRVSSQGPLVIRGPNSN